MSNYFQIFITLLSLLNPILAIGQFIDMTKGMSKEAKIDISVVCGLAVIGILGVLLFVGQYLMMGLGIHPYSLRLGGGIIVLILGIKIILGDSKSSDRATPNNAEINTDKIRVMGVSPLALPMVIGPASMVLVMIYGQDATGFIDKLAILAIIAILAVIISVTFVLSDKVSAVIGEVGLTIITKSIGLLLTAIAFEMMIAGIKDVIPLLIPHFVS
ncbi:MAG: MarC family protein [Burkholderiales bacterium]|nr:MarC family protein [Burkholderiales bacterium]